nr:unnamed protein product [Callosobruchus chinensis]
MTHVTPVMNSRKLKDAGSVEERNELQKSYEAHLRDADDRYKYKRKDKEEFRARTNSKMITVDLQKCLATPLLQNSQSSTLSNYGR